MYNEDILKIIEWFEWDVIKLIDNVLANDESDPHYSAVTCNNKIITLIKVKKDYSEKYKSVENYLDDSGYCKQDIKAFIEIRNAENKEYGNEILTL